MDRRKEYLEQQLAETTELLEEYNMRISVLFRRKTALLETKAHLENELMRIERSRYD